jgi:HAD superfamily phosphoserine phosphatase-like hydrolase
MAGGGTAYCFDLDGTVTSEEILPRIAREVGLYEEIATLTDITMAGMLPFSSSFKLRVRLLDSVPISQVQGIVAKTATQPRVVEFLRAQPDRCFLVTGNLDVWVSELTDSLGCGVFSSRAKTDGDRLLGIDNILDKGSAVAELRSRFDRIVAVGDGMNDTPMFEKADVRIAYGAVHPPVESLIKLADFVTYHEDGLCNLLSTL